MEKIQLEVKRTYTVELAKADVVMLRAFAQLDGRRRGFYLDSLCATITELHIVGDYPTLVLVKGTSQGNTQAWSKDPYWATVDDVPLTVQGMHGPRPNKNVLHAVADYEVEVQQSFAVQTDG
jgi:hypothetical protein